LLVGDENFVDVAAKHGIPVIHWLKDHPSSRWPEFNRATPENSRFLLMSASCERYFRRYCLDDARTGWVAGDGPNWRSRLDALRRDDFVSERRLCCLIPLNLRRVGGTLDDARARLSTLDSELADIVNEAIELAQFDLANSLDEHLSAVLAQCGRALTKPQFHFCFQILEETVQIGRRLKIFEVASNFPVLIQTDHIPKSFVSRVATVSNDPVMNGMRATLARMKSCRSVISANFVNDTLHERVHNGLNAGCVVIVEDTPMHRRLFGHRKNALLYRYDDDSLAECFDLVCNRVSEAYEIAQAGFRLRDDPTIRFVGYDKILELLKS
jgi:hypothetical protein